MHRPVPTLLSTLLAAAVVTLGISACSTDHEQRTALTATAPRWIDRTSVAFTVECADDVTATVRPGTGVDGLALVTIWGHPKSGSCTPSVTVELPAGTTHVDDAASGMVLELPAP